MRRPILPVLLPVLVLFGLLRPVVAAQAQPSVPADLARVLSASGLDQLGSRSRIAFTFHVLAGDAEVSRRWDWNLAENTVQQDGAEVGKTPKFINDVYWLLFPAMVRWDLDKVKIETHPDVSAPISGRPSTMMVVTYIDGAGSTPNDVYRLYLDEAGQIDEWSYHKAGAEAPTRLTTWEGYATVGGLRLSLERKGEGFRVWFTDVVVE